MLFIGASLHLRFGCACRYITSANNRLGKWCRDVQCYVHSEFIKFFDLQQRIQICRATGPISSEWAWLGGCDIVAGAGMGSTRVGSANLKQKPATYLKHTHAGCA